MRQNPISFEAAFYCRGPEEVADNMLRAMRKARLPRAEIVARCKAGMWWARENAHTHAFLHGAPAREPWLVLAGILQGIVLALE